MATIKNLTPMLPTAGDVAGATKFYADVLGFTVQYQEEGMAIMQRDTVTVFLTDVDDEHVASMTAFRIEVDDVETLFKELSAKGLPDFHSTSGQSISKLTDKPWGTREFAVKDPAGICYTFFQDRT